MPETPVVATVISRYALTRSTKGRLCAACSQIFVKLFGQCQARHVKAHLTGRFKRDAQIFYEMLYVTDVPAAVAIDEAIEIAKDYGTDDTPRFINGVLDRLRKKDE